MPIGRLIKNAPEKQELYNRLVEEWSPLNASTAEQPILIEDKGRENRFGLNSSTHLYVIWDEWEPLSQNERSEVIMEAYEQTHELPDVVRVTLAMGLTVNEARRMGIEYAV